jgi:uncharacterized protein YjiS (DUF1127 family)
MISTALNRLEAPPSSGIFPKREGALGVETSSRVNADKNHDRPRQSRNRGDFVIAVTAVVLAFVRVWRERHRSRHELAVMSERDLLDIGICRSDIANEVDKPFWLSSSAADAVR